MHSWVRFGVVSFKQLLAHLSWDSSPGLVPGFSYCIINLRLSLEQFQFYFLSEAGLFPRVCSQAGGDLPKAGIKGSGQFRGLTSPCKDIILPVLVDKSPVTQAR